MSNKSYRRAFSLIELAVVVIVLIIVISFSVTAWQKLMSLSQLNAARNLTNSSPVTYISDLVLWMETTSKDSFDEDERSDGASVSTWYDINRLSAVANDVAQSTPSEQPLYIQDAINGLPALRFDGSNDNLTNSSPIGLPSGNSDRTIFIVIDNASNSGKDWNIVFNYGTNSQLRTFDISLYSFSSSIGKLAIHMWDYDYITTKDVLDGNPYIIVISYEGNAGTTKENMDIYINSTFFDFDAGRNSGVNMILNTPSQNLFIGRRYTYGSHAKTDIGEIIIYDRALSSSEREQIEEYLSKKWQIDLD